MPDPSDYSSEQDWMRACVPTLLGEGREEEQAVAACLSMWRERKEMSNKAYGILEVKSIDSEKRTFTGIASTISLDYDKDIMQPEGVVFKTPIPILWDHKHGEPVGTISRVTVDSSSIKINASIPNVEEPGIIKDSVDRAWHAIKYGLMRGLSIGFSPIEYKFNEHGGVTHEKWNLYEVSLVAIPANAEATILGIKRAASGSSPGPGVSGKAVTNPKPVRIDKMEKSLAENIRAAEASRQAKHAQMQEIMAKAANDGRSLDESEAEQFEELKTEISTLDKHLDRYRTLESLGRAQAQPVQPAQAGSAEAASEARGGKAAHIRVSPPTLPKGIRAAQAVRCIWHAHHHHRDVEQVAKQLYPGDELVQKAAVAAGTTDAASWSGALVGDETNVFADFVEFLRPMTILGKFGQNGVPALRTAPFRVPLIGQTGGGEGYWVGEGRAKPLTSFDFSRTTLEPLMVANIAVVTEQLLRSSSPSADAILRDSLAQALQARLDTDFIDPNKAEVSGVSPASVTNGVSLTASSGTDGDAIRADIKAAVRTFIAANNPPSSGVWIMSSQTALSASLVNNALGQPEFANLSMNGGTLQGMPVVTSEYVAASVAGSPAVSTWNVYLINAQDIYLGDEGNFRVDLSREASLEMADNPSMAAATGSPLAPVGASLVSMFQTNSVAFRVEREINWKKRRASSVAGLSGVNWGG